jgi:hypothetical protein
MYVSSRGRRGCAGGSGVRKKDKVVCTRCDCQEEKEGGVQEFWVSERGRREACTRCGWASVRFLGKAPKSRFDACWIKLYTDIIIPPLLANYRGRCSHPSFCPNTSELVGGGGGGRHVCGEGQTHDSRKEVIFQEFYRLKW